MPESEFLRELLRHGEMGRKGEVRDSKEVYRDFRSLNNTTYYNGFRLQLFIMIDCADIDTECALEYCDFQSQLRISLAYQN